MAKRARPRQHLLREGPTWGEVEHTFCRAPYVRDTGGEVCGSCRRGALLEMERARRGGRPRGYELQLLLPFMNC